MTASEHTELPDFDQLSLEQRAKQTIGNPVSNLDHHVRDVEALLGEALDLLAARPLPDGAEPVPVAWREAISRVRGQLGQAGGTGTAGVQNSITEREVGGWVLDAVEDELSALFASPTEMGVTEERETFSGLKLKAVEALDQLAAYAHNNEALEDAYGESARAMHAATWNRVKVEQAVVAIRDMTVTTALHPTSETTEKGRA